MAAAHHLIFNYLQDARTASVQENVQHVAQAIQMAQQQQQQQQTDRLKAAISVFRFG